MAVKKNSPKPTTKSNALYEEIKCGVRPDQKAWLATVRPNITASALLRTAIDNRRKQVEKYEKYRVQVEQMKSKVPKEAWNYLAKR